MGMSFHCYVSLPEGNLCETYDLCIPPLESNNAGWKTIRDPCPVCWTWHFQFVILDYWKVLHVYHHLTSTHIHHSPIPWPLTFLYPPHPLSVSPGDFASTAAELVSMYHSVWRQCWLWQQKENLEMLSLEPSIWFDVVVVVLCSTMW